MSSSNEALVVKGYYPMQINGIVDLVLPRGAVQLELPFVSLPRRKFYERRERADF